MHAEKPGKNELKPSSVCSMSMFVAFAVLFEIAMCATVHASHMLHSSRLDSNMKRHDLTIIYAVTLIGHIAAGFVVVRRS